MEYQLDLSVRFHLLNEAEKERQRAEKREFCRDVCLLKRFHVKTTLTHLLSSSLRSLCSVSSGR